MLFRFLQLKTLAIIVLSSASFLVEAQTGPGGVGNSATNKIWLDANYLTGLANGAPIATFNDRSGNGWNAVQTTANRRPTYLSNQLNGNPIIHFDRSIAIQYMELTPSGIGAVFSNSNTVFVVGKANTGAVNSAGNHIQSLIAIPGDHNSTISFFGYPSTRGAYINNYLAGGVPALSTATSFSQGTWQLLARTITENASGTSLIGFVQGAAIAPVSNSTLQMANYTTNRVRIGAANAGSPVYPLNGDIAEIIVYNTAINDAQRVVVENYISAKYDLPVTNDKYTLNDAMYILDVEGIGTTDGNSSNKHSIASNSKGLKLTELNSSFNSANEFLLAGHASSTNAIVNTDLPISIQQRWQRIWYLEKTGSIDAKLSFDISDAGLTTPANLATEFSYYQLLYRSSTTGLFAVVPVIPALENGDQLAFSLSNEQLLNGYYTLGYSPSLIWTGALNTQWDLPGNWNLNRVPTTSDHVYVNACTTCPALNSAVTISGLRLNSGSGLNLQSYTVTVMGTSYLDGAQITSNVGAMKAADFAELKNSEFKGSVTLEKTGGSINSCYGGNIFSPELKILNSSDSNLEVATQASNVIQ